ncbi:hypothetical protein DV735_g5964, partial [Chaetothyriales sp. CBS 134920]
MPSQSKTPRSGSREKEEEYAVFMHPIPHNFRWQEIKDIARTYCAAPVRQADTVEPSHDLGYVLVAGLRSALKAYQGFCENGIAGRKVRVSLNGPYSSRKNFTNAVNHGQADKLICNNLAEFDQHQSQSQSQSQFQAMDQITGPGNRQSAPSASAVLGGYTNCNNIFAAQQVQFAYPNIMYSTATPSQLLSRGRNQEDDTSQQPQQSRSRTGGRTPRGVRIINLPGDVSKGELNKFLKRKTGGSVEPEATRIGRNGKFATAQTVFKKASCAGVAVSEIKSFGRWPVRVEFDEKSGVGADAEIDADAESNAEPDDGPVVVDGARGSRHKRPATESETDDDDDSSSDG